jgi:fluoroquinolone resistance protein
MQKQQVFEAYQLDKDLSEFYNSTFNNCDFGKQNFNHYEFTDCSFTNCDFSMANFDHLRLSNVKFINCKLLGVDFSKCTKFGFAVHFESSILNYCLFSKSNLKKTVFKKCTIKETVFTESELKSASFEECDLMDSTFEKCNLEECDFRTARNYSINPSDNKIKKAKFSYPAVLGLLNQYHISIEE